MPIKSDSKLLEQWDKHNNISEGALDEQHQRARDNHAFYAGDEMAYTATVTDKGRRATVVFNKVKPYVDSVAGFMIQLRRKPDYQARLRESEIQVSYSEYLDNVSDYFREDANMDHVESQQDKDMLIAGYGATDTNIVYDCNPDGNIRSECISFDDVFWDPQARAQNLLDARWAYRRKKFNRKEAVKRFPGSEPEDFESYRGEQTNYVYNPNGGLYDKIAFGTGTAEEDLVEVFYYQYWELETYYRAKNPLYDIQDPFLVTQLATIMQSMKEKRIEENSDQYVDDYFEFDPLAEYLVMTPAIRRDMTAAFNNVDIDVMEYQRHEKRVYYTAVITGDTILMKFRSPDQQGFTIKFKTASFDEQNKVWIGMVDSLKNPARYANKALTEILYVIASNSKGGVMYEESAVEDPARFEQQWATTKAAVKVSDGALSGGKIQPKAKGALPSGYENIYAISDNALGEVTGINKEFLGSSGAKQVSALLESQRVNQVVSTLATYFDSIALYGKEHARMMITFFRMLAENSQGRLVRLIGADGAKRFEELAEDKLAEEYDVSIGEAPTTATQKQETTQIMMQLADKLALLGQNIYPVAVQYLPIKASDKQKLLEILQPKQPSPQQLEQQQQLQQIQLQGQAARIAKDQSDALYKEAQAAKTAAEIPQVEVETDKTRAETLSELADAEQRSLENDAIRNQPINNLDLII